MNIHDLDIVSSGLQDINECDLSENFVSISSVFNDGGRCYHSGLIICYENSLHYFHYDGKNVLLEDINIPHVATNILIKKLDIIHELEVSTFLGHCQKLYKKGFHIKYGFVFNDSYYDSTSKEYFLVNAKYDITTCVGFCIKVIRGYLYNNPEYIKLSDWKMHSINDFKNGLLPNTKNYLDIYAQILGVPVEDIYSKDELKRISPSELLSSGYFNDLPITKKSIDSVCPILEEYVTGLSLLY